MNKYITLLVILAIIPWLVSADCPDLSTLTPPTHGAYVLNTETNTTATVICNMGYFTDSMDVIAVTCTNSTWNVTNPITCQPNMNTCNPFTLPNGLASDDITRRLKLDTDDVATFTCEMGTLVGPSTTTCLPNGTWSYMGENSSCQGRLCGALPAQLTQPEHGFYEILNDTSGRNIQTGVVLRCEASYKPITSQFYAATCNPETGMWSEVNPGTCQFITCPYPFPYHLLSVWENEDPYMHVNINDVHTLVCYNTSATQTSRVLVGSASVRCQADGKWDNIVDLAPEEMMLPANATQCADIPCPLLTITNGYFKIENQMSTEDDTIVQTFCDMGYTLRSSMAKVARCSATTKQWSTDETALGSSSTSFVAPSCLPISQVGCSDMDLHTLFPGATYHFNDMNKMGNVSAPGMMVTFQCAEGYQVMGSNSTVCNMNETWAPLQANTRCVDTRTTIPPTNTTAMPNTTTTNTTTMPTLEPTFEPTSDPNTDIPTEAPAGDITNKAATSSSSSFVGSGGFIALVVVVPVAAVAIITILILMYYCRTRKTEKQDMKDRIKQDTLVGPADVCINMTTNPTTPTAKGAEVQPQPQPQPQALPGTVV